MREGQSGWVLQAVISRASFRRIPRNGKSYFTMMSLHINNTHAKKRGIAKNLLLAVRIVMHQQQVDLVAGDFNGAAWSRQSGSDPRPISIIEETFVNTNLPVLPGPTPLLGPEACQVHGRMCVGVKPPGSENEWQVRMHGVSDMLGLKETDQSCHHEVWIHLLHVDTKFEKEELTLRPQQGQEAESLVRDHSREWYMSSVSPFQRFHKRQGSVKVFVE